jgi:hypothetical protein
LRITKYIQALSKEESLAIHKSATKYLLLKNTLLLTRRDGGGGAVAIVI